MTQLTEATVDEVFETMNVSVSQVLFKFWNGHVQAPRSSGQQDVPSAQEKCAAESRMSLDVTSTTQQSVSPRVWPRLCRQGSLGGALNHLGEMKMGSKQGQHDVWDQVTASCVFSSFQSFFTVSRDSCRMSESAEMFSPR